MYNVEVAGMLAESFTNEDDALACLVQWRKRSISGNVRIVLDSHRVQRGRRLLDWFVRSNEFESWNEENRSAGSCGIILSDVERFERIEDAATDGAEGSTHAEVIQDFRDAWTCTRGSDLQRVDTAIGAAIDELEAWHDRNGSLQNQIG